MTTNTDPVRALAELVDAAALMLCEIDTCGHPVDPAYRATLHDAWTNGQAALASAPADVDRLVRELDVALNGPEGAAAQASLCDLVGQVQRIVRERGVPLLAPSAPVGVDLPINDAVPPPTETRPGNLFLWNWTAMQQYGRACIAHALAQQPAAVGVPEGWVLVPRVATDEMIDAAMKARDDRIQSRAQASGSIVIGGASWAYTYHDTYRAMLAAAPTPPAAPSGEAVAWLRMTPDGTPDWAEDCIGSDDKFLDPEMASDGYYLQPLYAAPQQPAGVDGDDDAEPVERCESGLPDCGPAVAWDCEGVGACERCAKELGWIAAQQQGGRADG